MDRSKITSDLTEAKKFIESADLTSTIERLIKVHNWSKKHALKATIQYRRFLFLKKKYGEQHILPPSYDMDEVWHAHILHTQEYCNFCEEIFDGYLHHHPHHGYDNSITSQELESAFENGTQKLYRLEYGEDIEAVRPLPLKLILKRLMVFIKEKVKNKLEGSFNLIRT